jgi:hypothetical protein
MTALQVLNDVAVYSDLLPVSVAFFRYAHYDRLLRRVAQFVLVSLAFDFAFTILWAEHRAGFVANTLPLAHGSVAVIALLVGRVYEAAFADSPRLRRVVRGGTGLLVAFTVLNVWPGVPWFDGLWHMPSRAMSAQGVFFMVLALAYFYRLFTSERPVAHLERTGMFWVNSAVLIYFAITIFAFFLYNDMLAKGLGKISQNVHVVVNLTANVFYAIGLLCKTPQPPI